jgi:hypothetical protein
MRRVSKLIGVVLIANLLLSCNSYQKTYNRLKERGNDFGSVFLFLADSTHSIKEGSMLNAEDLKSFGNIGPIVEKLEQDGLLTNTKKFGGKSIYFKNKYCISFFLT